MYFVSLYVTVSEEFINIVTIPSFTVEHIFYYKQTNNSTRRR